MKVHVAQATQHLAALTAIADAVDAENFCSAYSALTDDNDGNDPVTFTCECGQLSGEYPDYETANTVLDAHLEAQEEARQAFFEQWRAEHADAGPPAN